jgi:predicted nucleic acid-binding protein
MAKDQKFIPLVKPLLDNMIKQGRWYSQFVYTDLLQKIGE